MKRSNLLYFILAICLFTVIACNNDKSNGYADNTTDTDRSMASSVSGIIEATTEQMAWVRQAEQMGTDANLRSQAQRMLPDLEKINADMKDYANKWKLNLDDIDTTVDLNERKGLEWDEEWADEIGDKNRRLIRRLERAEKRVEDTEFRNLISQSLPLLRTHLDSIQNLERRLDNDKSLVIK